MDLVRSFSILAVLAVHSSSFLKPSDQPITQAAFHLFERNGGYGVFIFFVVSGFLISHVIADSRGNFFNPNFRQFYSRRIGRIVPLLVLVILAGVCFDCLLSHDSLKVQKCFGLEQTGPWFWLSMATFTLNWWVFFKPGMLLGSLWGVLWSLSIEEQYYFIFPIALKKLGKPKNLVFSLLAFILAGLVWRTCAYFCFTTYWFYKFYFNSLSCFDLIAFGILLFIVSSRFEKYFQRNKGLSLIVCGTGFLWTALVYVGTFYSEKIDQIYASTAMGAGVFAFLLGGMNLAFFQSKYLKLLSLPGKYCYGMYLFHWFVLFLIGSSLPKINCFLGYFLFVGLTTAIAGFSYHVFEAPMNLFIRKLSESGASK